MDFDPINLSIFVFPSESVSSILMQMSVAIRSTPITVVYHILMTGLPMMWYKVPYIIGIFKARARIAFSWVSKICKFDGIFQPKDRSRIPDEVPVAFFSVELQSQTYEYEIIYL